MAECGENYIDCTKHNESIDSLFKRLISVDEDGNLSLNICGCGGGGGVLMYDVTYAELVAAIGGSTLIEGAMYRITDYATVHYFLEEEYHYYDGAGNLEIYTAPIEQIIVTALNSNTIHHRAYSESYPQDIIYYDWNPNNWLYDTGFSDDSNNIIPGFKGVIHFRHDTTQDVYTGYDFRSVKFRRWAVNVSDWVIGTTYDTNSYVKYNGFVYKSLQNANTGNTPVGTNNAWWAQIIDIQNSPYISFRGNAFNGITSDPNDYYDWLTFGDFYQYVRMVHIGNTKDDLNNAYWITTILSNNVFLTHNNYDSIQFDSIAFDFTTYGNTFTNYSESTGDFRATSYFTYNIISESFLSNNFGDTFSHNTIGVGCIRNSFNNYTINNYLGKTYTVNKSEYFTSNIIGNSCIKNDFGIAMTSCRLKGGTTKLTNNCDLSSVDFTAATIVYGNYSKTIAQRADGLYKLSYINNSDVLTIANATA